MKIWYDNGDEIKVEKCAEGLYVVRNINKIDGLGRIVVGPTISKKLAQDFLDSWAAKRLLACKDDLDVDLYGQQLEACASNCNGCLFWNNSCGRTDKCG